ncbi:phosphatidylethanolamine-binding protein [Epithele typhae]|uniref:phosphatidylethanolamine-binding protein n=1 Tax=Epithele typhae TaxID=378194 RepID=UPI00200799F0|nr:phosphatidylethanolamine-binding protein [Epithele typhae]KAH9914650.1 phosphatidylethanolamine-binding protein [Epithele typhae]
MRAHIIAAAAAIWLVSPVCAGLTTSDVEKAFKQANIIPDEIPDFTPKALLNVAYIDPATKKSISITPGKAISVNQTAVRPQYAVTSSQTNLAGQSFVLVMFDPDAPTPQNKSLAQVRHMIAQVQLSSDTKALASTAGSLLTNTSKAISEYFGPAPPAGNAHRYTILLFQEPASFASQVGALVNASTPVTGFNTRNFAHTLGLGAPVAGTFFMTGQNTANASPDGTGASSSKTSGSGRTVVGVVAATIAAFVAGFGMVAW